MGVYTDMSLPLGRHSILKRAPDFRIQTGAAVRGSRVAETRRRQMPTPRHGDVRHQYLAETRFLRRAASNLLKGGGQSPIDRDWDCTRSFQDFISRAYNRQQGDRKWLTRKRRSSSCSRSSAASPARTSRSSPPRSRRCRRRRRRSSSSSPRRSSASRWTGPSPPSTQPCRTHLSPALFYD